VVAFAELLVFQLTSGRRIGVSSETGGNLRKIPCSGEPKMQFEPRAPGGKAILNGGGFYCKGL
jgi:hypothetical protein